MNQDHITLYLTEERAKHAAHKILANVEYITSFEIMPGAIRWADGSTDRGFKVRIADNKGLYRYL
jgi:hypothetical protein